MRQYFAVFRRIGVRMFVFSSERRFNTTQLNIAIQRIFQRRLVTRRSLLRHVRNHPTIGHRNIAALRMQQAAQRREQRRFPGTISPHNPDLATWIDGDVGVFDERRGATRESEVNKSEHG